MSIILRQSAAIYLTKSAVSFILFGMENQKIGKLNILGSGLAFLITVYIGVIYILLMSGGGSGNIAYEITTDYAGYWAYRFVICILMYVCCIVNVIAIPSYFALKSKNSSSPARKFMGAAQLVSAVVMLVLVIMFWTAQGPSSTATFLLRSQPPTVSSNSYSRYFSCRRSCLPCCIRRTTI